MGKIMLIMLMLILMAISVEAVCISTDTLNLDESKKLQINNKEYDIKVNEIVYQDYAGGTKSVRFTVNGENTGDIEEGKGYTLSDGKVLELESIIYQGYAGGIMQAEFCIDGEAGTEASLDSGVTSAEACFALADKVGVVPHQGVLAEEGWKVSLSKAYGFEGTHSLKVISLNTDTITVDIDGERATLKVGESSVLSGVKIIITKREAGDPITYLYCAYETPETRLKLTCDGCITDSRCLPIGTRIIVDGQPSYCSIDDEFANQKGEDAACQNNYECTSNLCVDGKCVSPGLLTKILQWFKNLFS